MKHVISSWVDAILPGRHSLVMLFLAVFMSVPSVLFHVDALQCTLRSLPENLYRTEGDILIGGIFAINAQWQEPANPFSEPPQSVICSTFSVWSYGFALALVFTINEINREQLLLPNITLGFLIYDTCQSLIRTMQGTLQMLTGPVQPVLNYNCEQYSRLAAVIGEARSTASISIARLLGLYRYPQVSYFSSSPMLNDKFQFPSFFRTIPSDIDQAQLLHYMKRVRFTNKMGDSMFFDGNGNPPAVYDILNWHLEPDGEIVFAKVGSFDSRAPDGKQLSINSSAIQWNIHNTKVPISVCSESCSPGYRKAPKKGQPHCCFDCILCSEEGISNETDSSKCWPCPLELWPNLMRTECVPKTIEFLPYQEIIGCLLVAAGMGCFLITVLILLTFYKHRDTALVKANNRELSYLLLGALALTFLCPFLFVGEPQKIACLLRQPAFGIIFVLCVSCVLAKTIMVVIAFNATKPGSNMRRWLGPSVPLFTVSCCTVLQILICALWLLLCPPFPEKNMKLKTGTIVFQCNECSETAFWCMLGYMGLLSLASFLVAFLARNLPDSFNEAKWITFSMLVFLSVWMSFVPGYLSTQGKYMVAVEVFGIISSSAGILICIFFPKCYIILIKPELNTREHLLAKRTDSYIR
ncbi:extracellular calcium-sensing receptor-like [Lissotriton helveticus]